MEEEWRIVLFSARPREWTTRVPKGIGSGVEAMQGQSLLLFRLTNFIILCSFVALAAASIFMHKYEAFVNIYEGGERTSRHCPQPQPLPLGRAELLGQAWSSSAEVRFQLAASARHVDAL